MYWDMFVFVIVHKTGRPPASPIVSERASIFLIDFLSDSYNLSFHQNQFLVTFAWNYTLLLKL